jgi:hypothetical protein
MTITLAALALISTTFAATAQQTAKQTESVGLAVAPTSAPSRSERGCVHIAQVCDLLADPAIGNSVGLGDFTLDVTARADGAPLSAGEQRASGFTRACAMRDVELLTSIEEHGEAQDVAGDKLAEAFFTMMAARRACAEGREHDAFAIYDSVKLGAPVTHAKR